MVGSNTFVDTEIYAGNAQCAVVPSGADRCNGVCVGYSLPAKWWNGMWCDATNKLHSAYSMVDSIYTELASLIVSSGQELGAEHQLTNIFYGRSVILGEGATSECTDAVVIGSNASAYCEIEGVVIGNSAEACGYGAVAVGSVSTANGECSIAIGNSAVSTGCSVTIGANASSIDYSIAIGWGARSCSSYSVAIGTSNCAGYTRGSTVYCGIAIGSNNSVCSGLALGYCNNLVAVAYSYSNVIGSCNNCVMHNSIVIGNSNKCAISNSTVIGNNNKCVISNSTVIGDLNLVCACGGTVIGHSNCVTNLAGTNYPVRDAIVIGSNICVQHNMEIVMQATGSLNVNFRTKSGFVSYTYAAGSYTQREVFNELKQYIKYGSCNSLIGHYNGALLNYMQMTNCCLIQLGYYTCDSDIILGCIQCNSNSTINLNWSILFVPNN